MAESTKYLTLSGIVYRIPANKAREIEKNLKDFIVDDKSPGEILRR